MYLQHCRNVSYSQTAQYCRLFHLFYLDFYLVTRSEVDGEEVSEEKPRHVVQDQAVQRQVEGCNSCLLLLEWHR